MGMPSLSDDGRSGTLFGQRVSAEFVMALIAQMGGRAEINMWVEIERMREAGVRIIAQPKFAIAAPDVYRLVDRHGQPWPPEEDPEETITVTVVREPRKMLGAPVTSTTGRDDVIEIRPDLEDDALEGEIVEEGDDGQD